MKSLELIHPNTVARAIYNFNNDEQNILLFILAQFQPSYNEQYKSGAKPYGQTDLFGDKQFVQVKLTDIDPTSACNPYRIKQAFFSLNNKVMEIKTPEYETIARFVESPKYWYKKGTIDFKINADLVIAFESLAQGWFKVHPKTMWQLSVKGKRFYMLMCQHDDNGFVKIKALDLRHMLGLDGKYKKYSVFKSKIIDASAREIAELFDKGGCKLKFIQDMKISKPIGKDEWNRTLHFDVISYGNKNRDDLNRELLLNRTKNMDYIKYCLSKIFENNQPYLRILQAFIQKLSDEDLLKLRDRLHRLRYKISKQNVSLTDNQDCQKLVSMIIKEDFNYIPQGQS